MNRRGLPADVTLAALAVGVAPLLRRMRADFARDGRLRGSTSTLSWLAYTAFAVLLFEALTRRPAATSTVVPMRAAGTVLIAAGAALDVAAMRRFGSAAQLSGTDTGDLVGGGVYRWSRNPQYVGLVMALGGLSLVRRSPRALLLTGALAGVYRWWVPVEEANVERRFGRPYRDHLDATHRWWGAPSPR